MTGSIESLFKEREMVVPTTMRTSFASNIRPILPPGTIPMGNDIGMLIVTLPFWAQDPQSRNKYFTEYVPSISNCLTIKYH